MDLNKSSSETNQNNHKPTEGKMTQKVEQYTADVPSGAYLGLAVGSMLVSATIAILSRRKGTANFIGLWVPTIMLVGVYNKLVKMESSWNARLH